MSDEHVDFSVDAAGEPLNILGDPNMDKETLAALVNMAQKAREHFDSDPRNFAIWWTSAYDTVAIGHDIEAEFPDMPAYIVQEYHNRHGRNGRGRLWAAPGFPITEIEWHKGTIAARYGNNGAGGMTGAGIVIHVRDIHHVRKLPGIITDLEMNLL